MADYTVLYYEIYECPKCPTDNGKYYEKTPICRNRQKQSSETQRNVSRCFSSKQFAVMERNGLCKQKKGA